MGAGDIYVAAITETRALSKLALIWWKRAKSFQYEPIIVQVSHSISQNSFQCIKLRWFDTHSWNFLLWLQDCSRTCLAACHDVEAHFWNLVTVYLALFLLSHVHLQAFPLLQKDKAQAMCWSSSFWLNWPSSQA